MFLLYYILVCVLVGLLGRKRKSGFSITFVLSLFFTPVIVAILLLVTKERTA
jgi:hypothetical protein